MKLCKLVVLFALMPSASRIVTAQDLASALAEAREAAIRHQYQEVLEALAGFQKSEDPEVQYLVAAELGTAHFHLGQYEAAHQQLRMAVRLHPERIETALYLEATSYLVGDRAQALMVLREVLRSGARDLYAAVTLPGERQFLRDRDVLAIINEYAIPLPVDPYRGSVLGVALGDDRTAVLSALQAKLSDPTAQAVSAHAGPELIWVFGFDAANRLHRVLLATEALRKYTPYRLRIGDGLDDRATPAAAIAELGPPDESRSLEDGGLALAWEFETNVLTLEFGVPQPPLPLGFPRETAMIRAVHLQSTGTTAGRSTGMIDR